MSTAIPGSIRTHEQPTRMRLSAEKLTPLGTSIVALLMAVGVLAVSCGYALSRVNRAGQGRPVYVFGQLLVDLVPVLAMLRVRSVSRATGLALAGLMGAASFLIVQSYSPIVFRLEDEYQHLWTAQAIISTHHLFTANPALPVSTQFPGLEILTVMLSQLGQFSLLLSGTVVSGSAHVLMTVLVYLLARELGLTPRAAVIATVVFTTGVDYEFFLSYFVYETMAIPFFLATLIASLKFAHSDELRTTLRWGLSAIVFAAATIVSHHVTSYAMLIFLLIYGAASIITNNSRASIIKIISLTTLVASCLAIWDLGVATITVHYLAQIRGDLLGSSGPAPLKLPPPSAAVGTYITTGHLTGSENAPGYWRFLADLASAILAFAIPAGLVLALVDHSEHRVLLRVTALTGFSYYVLFLLYLYAPGRDQLVARSQGFLLLPVGVTCGLCADSRRWHELANNPPRWHRRSGRHRLMPRRWRATALFSWLIVPVVVGGFVASWPPYSAKLPGPYQIAAFERSTDARTITAGQWTAKALGTGNTFAADHRESLMIDAIGGQKAVVGTAQVLFETETFTSADQELIRSQRIRYIVADLRMTEQTPAEAGYFDVDPLAGFYARPLPASVITKFNNLPRVSRIFDDGDIVIYDVSSYD